MALEPKTVLCGTHLINITLTWETVYCSLKSLTPARTLRRVNLIQESAPVRRSVPSHVRQDAYLEYASVIEEYAERWSWAA